MIQYVVNADQFMENNGGTWGNNGKQWGNTGETMGNTGLGRAQGIPDQCIARHTNHRAHGSSQAKVSDVSIRDRRIHRLVRKGYWANIFNAIKPYRGWGGASQGGVTGRSGLFVWRGLRRQGALPVNTLFPH